MDLSGKVALVTGSTSGIGLGVAQVLAKAGAKVVLNGFGDAQSLLDEFARAGTPADFHPADLADPAEIEALFAHIEARHGRLDILVNNAGVQHVAAVQDFDPGQWDRVLAINLSAVFHTSRLALPGMLQRGFGRIINIASVHGQVGSTGKAAYVAAKHGVVGLTKVVGLETAKTPVTCNAICPGWVLTPLVQQQIDARIAQGTPPEQARHDLLAEKQPSTTFVTPDQLGHLVLFLCSEAASEVRGAAWNMDGGWLAQ